MLETTVAAVSADQLHTTCGDDPGWFCRNVLDWTGNRTLAGLADFIIGKPLTIIAIVVGAYAINRIARRGMRGALQTLRSGAVQERVGSLRAATPSALQKTQEHSVRAEQRIDALNSVLRSVVTFTIYTVAAFMVLGQAGINLGPLLAGAGIVGVALGFGSQSLVKDFLSGIFILVEDQFGVGDIVDLEGQAAGVVDAVSLRTTRLRAVEVAYATDLDHAERVIAGVAHELATGDADVIEAPEVWGVERLGANGISIRLVVKTRPSEQFRVSRELRRRIKDAFDREGIEIPFPQQTVWHRGVDLASTGAET